MIPTIRKRQYRINPETLQLERIEYGFRYWLRRSGGYLLSGVCIGLIIFVVLLYFFPSPREATLIQYNKNLSAQLELMEKQVDQMQWVMNDLSQRDDNLYRAILGAEPIPFSAHGCYATDILLRLACAYDEHAARSRCAAKSGYS